ncbi:MAG: DUF4159 domain-containing protein [Chitinophagaceae bacterium]|nr:DUF4159 domain-containing protein [Chitinophagaceae bacterium]
MNLKKYLIFIACLFLASPTFSQKIKLGLLVYGGGGDWYANPTALKNLANFCNAQLGTSFEAQEGQVEAGSREILNYPILFATGHGRIMFNDEEAQNIRMYLMGGGFLHIDDNYGLDKYVRPALKKVFPELDLVELPFTHAIYHQKFDFANGLPKIHEHDKKAPKGYGLIYQGRLVCFYSTETDLNDGWEDPEVHKDPEEKRLQALKMGANIVQYAFMNL